tara:strand:+ start:192 stop:365 length:174 start_codon:yes stop_codon:yes gene_type:complete
VLQNPVAQKIWGVFFARFLKAKVDFGGQRLHVINIDVTSKLLISTVSTVVCDLRVEE